MSGTTSPAPGDRNDPPTLACTPSALRSWPVTIILAAVVMGLLQLALHEFFMRLPMLQYHLISALVNAAVVAVTAVLYQQWRCTAITAHEALRQLRASEALRDDLISMLVHDLKTPLVTSLAGSRLLLARTKGLAESERGILDMAVRSQVRLVSMIEDLLDTARAEEGKLPLDIEDNDLAEIIVSVAGEAALPAEQAEVHLATELPPCPLVSCDAEKMRRVAGNLVANAIKFTPSGGSVTVALNCTDADALVSVQDTGSGIPPDAQTHIFDKFAQAEAAAEGRRLSVGLGLTFCKLAVEAHGGRIWVDSSPGEGSTFTFSLPLRRTGA